MMIGNRQHGTVLVLCITLVTLLGLIGMSAIQVATQQQRMSTNQLAAMQAFEAAERLLRVGESRSSGVALCNFCLPPPQVERINMPGQAGPDVHWQAGESGLYAIQNLGVSTQAAHMPADLPVTLFRVTAIGLERHSRVVLESVYAWPDAASGIAPRRIAWRQVI